MSLLASLSSSSFFLSDYLTKRIQANDFNENQFSYALKNNNVAALIIEEAKVNKGSEHWLTLNRQLGKTQSVAALKLARWYQNTTKKQAVIADNMAAIMWFEQAIRLHSQEAIIGLSQHYFDLGKAINAKNTLNLLASNPAKKYLIEPWLILKIKIAIHLGDITLVEQLLQSPMYKLYGKRKVKDLASDIINYSIITDQSVGQSEVQNKANPHLETSSSCISSIQLFATNLAHLKHLDQIIKSFKAQQPIAQYICLPKPKYISTKLIDCSAKPQQAISCNEAHWLNVVGKVNSRHVGLMLAEGGANVHQGILYFDAKDDVNVFSHEVSHLLGFVDEYPLIKTHNKCQSAQQREFSHNIVVLNDYYHGAQQVIRKKVLKNIPWASHIKPTTPILQLLDNSSSTAGITTPPKWRLGTPVEYKDLVGLHMAESCENTALAGEVTSYSAYKPVSRRTQLRYYASHFPSEYLLMLAERPLAFLMPSFHYNIALALFQKGKVKEARLLLIQAHLWEKDPQRKAAILKGNI